METSINIAGVCGSLSATGATKNALSVALRGAEELAGETNLIELRDYELPFCGATPEEDYPQDVSRLRAAIRRSHGIILGTPEYHGSLSGVLKNMLDLMGATEFEGKVIGLVGVAGGRPGATNSLNAMRLIGRNLHSWVLPQEVSVGEAGTAFDEDGEATDPDIERRLLNLGEQVVRLASLQQKIKEHDFLKVWQGLPTW